MTDWRADSEFPFKAPLSTGPEVTHTVYVKGEGPPILLMQELPGIGPETLALVDRLNAAGFKVYLPHMLGTFGKITMKRNILRLFCIRREFNMWLKGRQSPITGWLRALVADIQQREGGARVGVIGMCLTGAFALPLMAEDAVSGAVASQPALPFNGKGALQMTAGEVQAARAAMAEKGTALAMRYTGDKLVPDVLWEALQTAFGDTLEVEEYPSDQHSLLTLHFHQPAYDRMEAYFKTRFGMA